MVLWIDADSCPRAARDLVCKTGKRLGLPVRFVANHPIPGTDGLPFEMVLTEASADAADDYIVENSEPGDLVVTRDIPLAKRLVDRSIPVINDRGVVYTERNINERLSMRNLMLDLYKNGIAPDRTGTYGKKELNEFANALDREVQRLARAARNAARNAARSAARNAAGDSTGDEPYIPPGP